MRLISLVFFVLFATLQALALLVQQNHPCNNQRDTLLAEDPEGTTNAFLRCRGVGIGTIGFWERKICPNNMQFDFIGQQCRTDSKKYRNSNSEKRLNIAILNNSCAKGEQCIGGTVCDLETMKCLCPYGTMAHLETLSCVRNNYNYRQVPDVGFLPPAIETVTPAFFRPPPLMGNGNQQSSFVLPPRPSIFPSAPAPLPSLAVSPGSSCREGQMCGGGSVCTMPLGVCLCPGELEDHGGECVAPTPPRHAVTKVGLGAICNRFAECDDGGSCVEGRCQCVSPLVESNGKCILQLRPKEVGPGEPCDNGEVCIRGSICYDQVPVCVCPSDATLVEDRCVRTSLLQPPPSSPVDQLFDLIYHKSRPFPAGILPTTYSYTQLPSAMPTARPPPQAKPNLVKLQLGGSKQAGVGVPCSLNTDCMIGAYCNGNTEPPSCQCLSTHVSINGRCEKVIYPGQTGCQHDSQCSAAFEGANCIDRECICPEGSQAIEQTCVSVSAYPGEACHMSRKVPVCAGASVCIDDVCTCPPPLVHLQRQCVNKTDIIIPRGSPMPCKRADDCPPDLLCLDGRCRCPPGMNQKGATCTSNRRRRRRRAVRQQENSEEEMICWPDQQICANGKGLCLGGMCHCSTGYVQVNGRCNPEKRPPGAFCDGDRQCEEGAVCNQGLCSCVRADCFDKAAKTPLIEERVGKMIGEICNRGETCRNGSTCTGGRCQCEIGFELKDGDCQRSSSSGFTPINSQCNEADRCAGGSVCSANICSCIDGSVETSGKCRQLPGGRCAHGETCAGDSVCEMAVCRCPTGTRLASSKCHSDTVMPGRSCQEGQTCAHGSNCRFGVCMCSAGYRIVGDRCEKRSHFAIDTQPKPSKLGNAKRNTSAKPGQLCLDGEQCSGGSQCNDGFCLCPDEQVIIADQCIRNDTQAVKAIEKVGKAAPGQFCQENTTCTGASVCLANICTCPQGTALQHGECVSNTSIYSRRIHSEPRKTPDFLPGTACEFTSECPYRTECVRGVCRCRPGETIVDSLCRTAVYAVSPGGKCDPKLGLDCVGESHCVYGVCVCTRGLVNAGVECAAEVSRVSDPGETCMEGQRCAGGSLCSLGVCKCLNTELIRNKRCVPGSPYLASSVFAKSPPGPHDRILNQLPELLGDPSRGINQILTANSMSINLVDRETLNSLVVSRARSTLPALGEHCEGICADGAICSNSICKCSDDSIEDSRGHKCLRPGDDEFAVRIGDLDQHRRVENLTLHQDPWRPSPYLPAGDFGVDQRPNSLPSSDIYSGQITSSPVFVRENSYFPATGIAGQGCTENGQCFHGSSCINGVCICAPGHVPINGICQTAVRPGGSCEFDEQCSGGGSGAQCRGGVCRCAPDRVPMFGRCLSRPAARPGEACGARDQICGFGAYCSSASGVCECPVGMASAGGVCRLTMVPRGLACATSFNCPKSAFCDNGYCLCKSTHEIVNGFCVPRPSAVGQEHILPEYGPNVAGGVTTFGAHPENGQARQMGYNNPYDNLNQVGNFQPENDFGSNHAFGNRFDRFENLNGNQFGNNYGNMNQGQFGQGQLSGYGNYGNQQGFGNMNNGYGLGQNSLPNYGSNFGNGIDNGYLPRSRGGPRVVMIKSGENFGMNGKPLRPISNQLPGAPFSNQLPGASFPTPPGQYVQPMPSHAFVPVPICPSIPCPMSMGTPSFPFSAHHRSLSPPANRSHASMPDALKVAMPNGFCGNGEMCLGNSWCVEQFCRCAAGMILENGVCMNAETAPIAVASGQSMDSAMTSFVSKPRNHPGRQALPLQSCSNGEKCLGDSICQLLEGVGAICACDSARLAHNDQCINVSDTQIVSGLSESCLSGELCSGGATCNLGRCVCPEGRSEHKGHCIVVAHPGEACGEGQVCIEESMCDDDAKECVCEGGRRAVTGKCTETRMTMQKPWTVLPGDMCDEFNQCVDNAYCSPELGICSCLGGLFAYDGQCIHSRHLKQPGELCDAFDICFESTCSDGVCVCGNGQIPVNGSCTGRPAFPVQTCSNSSDCVPTKQCIDGLCSCGQSSIEAGDNCIPLYTLPTAECDPTNPQSCPDQANCSNGRCICVPPLVMHEGRCAIARTLGEVCTSEEACLGGSFCIDGSCVCPDGSRTRGSLCLDGDDGGARPGESCAERACGGGARCLNRFCVCGFAMNPVDDRCLEPVENVPAGGFCFYSSQCKSDLVCMNSLCMCINQSNSSISDCAQERTASPPGGSCAESQQCSGGSICREGWCVCPDAMMIVSRGICVQSQPRPTTPPRSIATPAPPTYVSMPGVATLPPYFPQSLSALPPSSSYPSSTSYSRSSLISSYPTTTATRRGPFTPTPTEPRKAAAGTNCGPLDMCVGGSVCHEGLCICPAGTTISNGACALVPRSMPEEKSASGDLLESYWPMLTTASTSSYSSSPRLVHASLTPPQTSSTVSRPRHYPSPPEADLQSIVEPVDECAAVGLYCRGGTVCRHLSCQCPETYILHNDQCVPGGRSSHRRGKSWAQGEANFARPNEPCNHGETCTGGSVCGDKKVCICPPHTPVIRENTCIASDEKPMMKIRPVGPGEPCNSETRCTSQSICYQGMCRCQAGYTANSGQCLPIPTTTLATTVTSAEIFHVGLDQPCGDERRCSGGAICDEASGLCSCPHETLPYNGACIATVTTRHPTTPTRPFSTSRISHSSSLSSSSTGRTSTLPVRVVSQAQSTRPGQCSDDTQCEHNRVCVVGRCKCRPGYSDNGGVCEQVTDEALDRPVPTPAAMGSGARLTGPPIRRPRPKATTRATASGAGSCPPGNEPLRDDDGMLMVCNGMEPNCPPRAYCYVTGLASESYNCCKSW